MDFAVIKTGGKQYFVEPAKKIKIEKLVAKEGEEFIFNDVLLLEKNGKLSTGEPKVEGAKVAAKVLRQARARKITIIKYKPKKRYRKKQGHRQMFTEVEITRISDKQ
ncbi:MAG: 50S ribosomal protein L21 [Patescibacteria group bacterium]|nr:50S ribosomal protein L21 [Patescibacteria group bacterium]